MNVYIDTRTHPRTLAKPFETPNKAPENALGRPRLGQGLSPESARRHPFFDWFLVGYPFWAKGLGSRV